MSPQTQDPRITELLELAAAEGLPLAVRPETVCALRRRGVDDRPIHRAVVAGGTRQFTRQTCNLASGVRHKGVPMKAQILISRCPTCARRAGCIDRGRKSRRILAAHR